VIIEYRSTIHHDEAKDNNCPETAKKEATAMYGDGAPNNQTGEVTTQEVATEVATEQEFEFHEYLTSDVFEHREVVQRLAVAFMFDNTFKACEDRSKWF
jgi:hypothetical protein